MKCPYQRDKNKMSLNKAPTTPAVHCRLPHRGVEKPTCTLSPVCYHSYLSVFTAFIRVWLKFWPYHPVSRNPATWTHRHPKLVFQSVVCCNHTYLPSGAVSTDILWSSALVDQEDYFSIFTEERNFWPFAWVKKWARGDKDRRSQWEGLGRQALNACRPVSWWHIIGIVLSICFFFF